MGDDLSAGGLGRRRGFGRAAALSALALSAILVAVSGCGSSGHGARTDPEKGADAAILNAALTRELTLQDLYARGRAIVHGRWRIVDRKLLAQEQEYADAVTKSIRGLGGETEGAAEEVDLSGVRGQAAFLALAAELENVTIEFYVDKAAQLYTPAPRTLDAWLAAGHGGHLALLPSGEG